MTPDDLLPSWARSMRAANRSERTVQSYAEAVRLLHKQAGLNDVDACARLHVEAFIADQLAHNSPATAAVRYRSLRQWFKWLVEEGELDADPMVGMSPPHVPDRPPEVVSDGSVAALLKVCEGKRFEDRRDSALLRVFVDTGCRLSEVCYCVVDLELQEVDVVGKGRKPRSVPFGDRTALALDRYLRLRRKHPSASSPVVWLGQKGPMTPSGITQMLKRRSRQAGVPSVNPHAFRHAAASWWLEAGGQEGDLQRLMGWSDPSMLRVYGRAEADRRARAAHRRMAPGDRF